MKIFILLTFLLVFCYPYNKIKHEIYKQKTSTNSLYHPMNCTYHEKYYRNIPYIYFKIKNNTVIFIGRSKLLHNKKIFNDFMDNRRLIIQEYSIYLRNPIDCIKCIYLPNDPNIVEDLYCSYLKLYNPPKNKHKICHSKITINTINMEC